MSLRSKRSEPRIVGNPHDRAGFYALLERYLIWHQERQSSEQSLRKRRHQLMQFLVWCDERGLQQPAEVTLPILERYQRALYLARKANDEPLSVATQCNRLAAVKSLFSWLTRRHLLLSNPAADLAFPKQGQRLPKDVLSQQEVDTLLAFPDIETKKGLRDRAMLEVLYSTGIRRAELAELTLYSINHEAGTVMIRQGKGKKDRLIPIGERACHWVRCYQEVSRPALLGVEESPQLFLAKDGAGFSLEGLSCHVRELLKSSGVRTRGGCHLLRHTMATLMLENGADTRWIQMMLGHADLSTTQIYTRVSIQALKAVHTATHPAQNGKQKYAPEAAVSSD